MGRLTIEYDSHTKRFRIMLERDARLVAAGQVNVVRDGLRLLSTLAAVFILGFMVTHPISWETRSIWPHLTTHARLEYLVAGGGVLPSYMFGQPDTCTRDAPGMRLPLPDSPAFVVQPFDVFYGDRWVDVADTCGVSLAAVLDMNPTVDLDGLSRQALLERSQPDLLASPIATIPTPPWEVRVYRAAGGETLADVADWYDQARSFIAAGQYDGEPITAGVLHDHLADILTLAAESPVAHDVTAADMVATNALAADTILLSGQAVYVPVFGVSPARGEYVVKRADGSACYTARSMVIPVPGPISKGYGGVRNHAAVDTPAPFGYRVLCPRDGAVLYAGNPVGMPAKDWRALLAANPYVKQELGNQVVIGHRRGPDGAWDLVTVFGHLSGDSVDTGDDVVAYEVIGRVGNNGHSFGSHLHFETWVAGKPVKPAELLRRSGE